ncbi:MAG: DMSO/selenate family reductase complex A subunit [Bacillota bacterium]
MADGLFGNEVSRRTFIKWSSAIAGTAAVAGWAGAERLPFSPLTGEAETPETIVPSGCANNCGGRCVIKAHVRDGKLVRITSDPAADTPDLPALRACLRGRSYRQMVYNPDRVKHPMKRVGKRGEGKFGQISWDEATTMVAEQIKRISKDYGPLALYPHYGWGLSGMNCGNTWIQRLLGLYNGDWLNYARDYSAAQTEYATPLTYGTFACGDFRENWVHSRLIILDGFNPAENVFGTNTTYFLRKAKEAGARIVVIDPRYTDTAVAFADDWIPIRPNTDSALFVAMAYVIISENLYDQALVDKIAQGFDEAHMPPGIPPGNSFKSYVLGEGDDKTPKTPEWAEKITGIPARTIKSLARQYATMKPAALVQGYGPQRHASGEQTVRTAIALATITGNLALKGGGGSGIGMTPEYVATDSIPVKGGSTKIPVFLWTDAITRGTEMTKEKDGIEGADRLPSNIKLIFNMAGNAMVNQHADINKTVKILQDESLVEFIVTSDIVMTPTARFSDLVLPAASVYERCDLISPWGFGQYLIWINKAIDPLFEARQEYDWIAEVAAKLGLKDQFTEGKTAEQWLEQCLTTTAKTYPEFPGIEAFKKAGVFRVTRTDFTPPLAPMVEAGKFPTPSGKIEIFSQQLWDRNQHEEVPAIPKYVPGFEGPLDPLREKYPLQLHGWHYKRRAHSIHDDNPWMEEAARQEMWMNPADAEARGIKNGDKAKVFNDRGATILPVKVTVRIMPGVVAIPQGAWYTPGPDGVDRRGALNVLTNQRPTAMAWANAQHTNLVEVARA